MENSRPPNARANIFLSSTGKQKIKTCINFINQHLKIQKNRDSFCVYANAHVTNGVPGASTIDRMLGNSKNCGVTEEKLEQFLNALRTLLGKIQGEKSRELLFELTIENLIEGTQSKASNTPFTQSAGPETPFAQSKEPRQTDQELCQILVTALVDQLSLDQLERAYLFVTPRHWSLKFEQEPSSMIQKLKEIGKGNDRVIKRFVAHLINEPHTAVEVRENLLTWFKTAYPEHSNEFLETEKEYLSQKAQSSEILIQILVQKLKSSRENNEFLFCAWFIPNSALHNSQTKSFENMTFLLGNRKTSIDSVDESIEPINSFLNNVLSKVSRHLYPDQSVKQIVELFLPRELLFLPFEQMIYEIPGTEFEGSSVVKHCDFRLRIQERLATSYSSYRHFWTEKWKDGYWCNKEQVACNFFLPADQKSPSGGHDPFMDPNIIGIKTGVHPEILSELNVYSRIMQTGLPLALCSLSKDENPKSKDDNLKRIDTILTQILHTVPAYVQPLEVPRNIGLVWDNPYWLPPRIDYQEVS